MVRIRRSDGRWRLAVALLGAAALMAAALLATGSAHGTPRAVSTGQSGDGYPVAHRPGEVPGVFAQRFNSGELEVVLKMYAPNAVLVAEDGPVSGRALRAALARHQSLGIPIVVRPRHVYVRGDTALLIVDWVIDGRAPDGAPVHLEGAATDVVRKGPGGIWRYVIDNPFGTAELPPAS